MLCARLFPVLLVLTAAAPVNAAVLQRLGVGQTLVAGDSLQAPQKAWYATLRADGNLAVYRGTWWPQRIVLTWYTNIPPTGTAFLKMQSDGNLVLFAGTPAAPGPVLWAHNQPGDTTPSDLWEAVVMDGGRIVVRRGPNGPVRWSSPSSSSVEVKTNDVVYIQSEDGGNLSARQGEVLAMSNNTDAWEQWTWQDGATALSYHGTSLIAETGGDRLLAHAPPFPWEGRALITRLDSWSGLPVMGGPRFGESVAIVFFRDSDHQRFLLCHMADGSTAACPATDYPGKPVEYSARWVIQPAPSASVRSGRSPARLAMRSRAATGTYEVHFTDPANSKLVTVVRDRYDFLGLAPSQVVAGNMGWFIQGDEAARFGKSTSLFWDLVSGGARCGSPNHEGLVDSGQRESTTGLTKAVFSPATPSTKTDHVIEPCPGDIYGTGDRIPRGARVCIRYALTGKYLSRAPNGWVVWSSNKGVNETFVIDTSDN